MKKKTIKTVLVVIVLLIVILPVVGYWFIQELVSRGYSIGLYLEAMELYVSNHQQLPETLEEIMAEYCPGNDFRLPDVRYPTPIYRPIDYSAVQPDTRYLVLAEPPNAKAFLNRYVVYWSPLDRVAEIEALPAWQMDDYIAADDAVRRRNQATTRSVENFIINLKTHPCPYHEMSMEHLKTLKDIKLKLTITRTYKYKDQNGNIVTVTKNYPFYSDYSLEHVDPNTDVESAILYIEILRKEGRYIDALVKAIEFTDIFIEQEESIARINTQIDTIKNNIQMESYDNSIKIANQYYEIGARYDFYNSKKADKGREYAIACLIKSIEMNPFNLKAYDQLALALLPPMDLYCGINPEWECLQRRLYEAGLIIANTHMDNTNSAYNNFQNEYALLKSKYDKALKDEQYSYNFYKREIGSITEEEIYNSHEPTRKYYQQIKNWYSPKSMIFVPINYNESNRCETGT